MSSADSGHGPPSSFPPVPAPYPRPAGSVPVAAPLPLSAQAMPAAVPRPVPVAARPVPVPVPQTVPSGVAPAARPIPVAPRPVPVSVVPTGNVPVVKEEDEEDGTPDPTARAARAAPPWLVSLVVHMVLIIILALLSIPLLNRNQVEITAQYAEEIGEQLIDDTLQSPESLDMDVKIPELSFDSLPTESPLAAPPELDISLLDANKATDNIPAPSIGLALSGREAGSKKALLAAYGGNATTEEAVRRGLEWLAKQQMKDGGWSLTGPYPDGATIDNRLSATAMALLAFQGNGQTHLVGDFKDEVKRGWDYLLKLQNPDGYFEHDSAAHHRLYAQAQATIAICEIYGMTKDEKFKRPAQLALNFAHKAQAPEGGWRYEPQIDSDTSVTGWYVMALQSGLMAGLEVQSPALDKINQFLDRSGHENGSKYAYKPGMEATLTMTAEGLLCRQYLGWKHEDERMRQGIEFVLANPIDYADQNVYYWYYATQACHHMDGEHWNRWNAVMRQAIPEAQLKTGNDRGSWASSGDRWGPHGGRLYVTCLSIYMLEVYYRHLPIYKWRLQ
jgi:hypothetical protein